MKYLSVFLFLCASLFTHAQNVDSLTVAFGKYSKIEKAFNLKTQNQKGAVVVIPDFHDPSFVPTKQEIVANFAGNKKFVEGIKIGKNTGDSLGIEEHNFDMARAYLAVASKLKSHLDWADQNSQPQEQYYQQLLNVQLVIHDKFRWKVNLGYERTDSVLLIMQGEMQQFTDEMIKKKELSFKEKARLFESFLWEKCMWYTFHMRNPIMVQVVMDNIEPGEVVVLVVGAGHTRLMPYPDVIGGQKMTPLEYLFHKNGISTITLLPEGLTGKK